MADKHDPLPGRTALVALADFTSRLSFDDLPAAVVAKMKVHFLDTLGASLAGTRSKEFRQVSQTIELRESGASLWASGLCASARDAALVNGVAAHVFELDDTGGCDHSGAVVVPAVLAAAEGRNVSGRELIVALIVGYEVGRRLLEAAGGYDGHNGAGWHSTGTCGAMGAAAAVARLWNLDPFETAHAITIATSFSSGLWAFIHDGAQTKKLHAGRAAEGGLLAAQLARSGMIGPSQVFDEVWGGFFGSYNHASGDPTRFTAELGAVYKLMRVSLKPYASCRGAHSAVDALEDVLAETGASADAVAAIDVRASGMLVGMCGKSDVERLAAAQMSLPLALALRIVHGTAGLSAYAGSRRFDPRIAAMLNRIRMARDESMASMDEPVLTISLTDGRRFERMVPRPSGSPERPMSAAAIDGKFAELAGMALEPAAVGELARFVEGLEHAGDIAPLHRLLHAGSLPDQPFA